MKAVVFASLLSAAAASSVTWMLSAGRPPAPRNAPPAATAADFKAALEDLEREVSALRREMAERDAARPLPAPGAGPPVVPARPARPGEGPPDPGSFVRNPSTREPLPATVYARLREVFQYDADGELVRDESRKWMMRSEADVIEWFGIPESIGVSEGGLEYWNYEVPTGALDEAGDPETVGFTIQLNRGRVLLLSDD